MSRPPDREPPPASHYSYAAYADPAMAASFDHARFGGPIGRILLEDQERVLMAFLGTKTEVPQGGVVWVFALRD